MNPVRQQFPNGRDAAWQKGQGAEFGMALVGTVKVAAPRGGQAKLAGGVSVGQVFSRCVAAGDHFDALPAVAFELGE